MKTILGIKFRDYGQIYFYSLSDGENGPEPDPTLKAAPATIDADAELVLAELGPSACASPTADCPVRAGDFVLAETGQGLGLGTVVHVSSAPPSGVHMAEIRPVLRTTTDKDRPVIDELNRLGVDAFRYCTQRIRGRQLDMKLVDVEILFDKSKFVFYFTAPTRIDFRELVKDLVREYHVRIELRQIGVRHETQMIGAVGNCGMVCCCRRFLRKFAPVTIKMAKEQNLFLNPTKISGICGRLLCCLSYEQDNYDAFHRECPRLGKRYQTSQGDMKVLRANMFRNSVVVLDPAGEEQEFTLEDWRNLEPKRPDAPQNPQGQPINLPRATRPPQHDGFMVMTADPDSLDALPDFELEENALSYLESDTPAEAGTQNTQRPRNKRPRRP